jgi:hypothetical protein
LAGIILAPVEAPVDGVLHPPAISAVNNSTMV